MPDESTRTVVVAIVADLGVALAKLGTAVFTGSSAVAATASEALADTANDLFLLLAQHRGNRAPDDQHALGYGREAYFWALLAGLGVFVGGAVFSLREGIEELLHPGVTSSFTVAYVVLAVSAGFDLLSIRQSLGQLTRRAHRFHREVIAESRATSDPSLRTVFVSDVVSIAADVLTLIALALNQITGSSIPQGIAAVLIGLALVGFGLRLVRRNHDFLVGAWTTAAGEAHNKDIGGFTQPLQSEWAERARALLLGFPGVTGVGEILTTFVGPNRAWIVARIEVDEGISGAQVVTLVHDIESSVNQLDYIYRIDVVPIAGPQVARRSQGGTVGLAGS
ncbi:MAG TPA: cation diffusion facilitator family transporter [Acidimicrobiales bacterium]|nr:cation diffusion facilitator family transporter [Acidimicrobiales bacterium]